MRKGDRNRTAYRALEERILTGPGSAPADQRARAFAGTGLSAPLDELADAVATRSSQITDAQFAAALAAG